MINVVGASQDPEKVTPATIYSFTPSQKKPAAAEETPEPELAEAKSALKPLASVLDNTASLPEIIPVVKLDEAPRPVIDSNTNSSLTPAKTNKPGSKKSFRLWLLMGVLLILAAGIGVSVYLTQSSQDIRQQASEIEPPIDIIETELVPTIEPTAEPTITTGIALQPGGLANLASQTTPETEEEAETDPVLESDTELDQLALAGAPTTQPTVEPTQEMVNTTISCNESCVSNDNCENLAHVCYQGYCRLNSNPTSTSCLLISGGNQISIDQTDSARVYSPNASPSGETPAAGPQNWLLYGLSGFGLLIMGGLAVLLL